MSELEDRLTAVLNDPEQLLRVTKLAQSLMGGAAAADDAAGQPSPDRAAPEGPAGLGIDPALLGKLGTLLNDSPPGGGSQQAVLRAMLPALKPRRREKLERAMRLAKLARLAKGGLPF